MKRFFEPIKVYLAQNGVKRAAIFGSFARGEETSSSDIDLLIEKEDMTFFDVLKMEEDLEALMQRKIDIVEYKAIKPNLKKYIQAHQIALI